MHKSTTQSLTCASFRKVTRNDPRAHHRLGALIQKGVHHAQATAPSEPPCASWAIDRVNFPALDGAAQHVSNECGDEAGNSVDDGPPQQPTKRPRIDSCIGTGCSSNEILDMTKLNYDPCIGTGCSSNEILDVTKVSYDPCIGTGCSSNEILDVTKVSYDPCIGTGCSSNETFDLTKLNYDPGRVGNLVIYI